MIRFFQCFGGRPAPQRPTSHASGRRAQHGADATSTASWARTAFHRPDVPAPGAVPQEPVTVVMQRLPRLADDVPYDCMIRTFYPLSIETFAEVIEHIRTRNALPDRGRTSALGGTLTVENLRERDPSVYVQLPALALVELIDRWAGADGSTCITLELFDAGNPLSKVEQASELARRLGCKDANRIRAMKGIVRFKIAEGLETPRPKALFCDAFGATDEPLLNQLTQHIIAAVYTSGLTEELEEVIAAACRA